MMNKVFLNNDILGTALNASAFKNEVIQNNIANADTPNYKKRDVYFESILDDELNSAMFTGEINFDNLKPVMKSDPLSYRMDGNNVDLNVEMVEMYKNSVKYDTLAQSVMNNYKRINVVLGK